VNHRARLGWTLAISLVLWLPVALRVVNGEIDLPAGGMYYLIALALGWFGTGVIMTIASGYSSRSRAEAQRAIKEIEAIERRHKVEALEERRRQRNELGEGADESDGDPAVPRPRRSDGDDD
jgi:hypothetical protein